jgi:hypothetical protein
MYMTSNGNLGIGTTNPTSTLYVNGTGNFSGVLTAPTAVAGTNNTQVATTAFVANVTSNVYAASNNYVSAASSSTEYIAMYDSNTGLLQPKTNSGLVYNSTSNYLGIGTTNPTSMLHVNGNIQYNSYAFNFSCSTSLSINSSTGLVTFAYTHAGTQTNNGFKAPVNGYYLFTMQINATCAVAGEWRAGIYQLTSGSLPSITYDTFIGTYGNTMVLTALNEEGNTFLINRNSSMVVKCTAGYQYNMYITCSGGTVVTYTWNSTSGTAFSGYLISTY